MHSQWEELIPFYIANILSPKQARALEAHLATCDSCRQSLEQWRAIAGAVREEAVSQGRGLPPLSPQVRHTMATQRPRPDAALLRSAPRTWRVSYAAVAAAAAVLIAVGLVAVFITQTHRGQTQRGSIAALLTATGTRSTAQTPNATLSVTSQHDFGIVTPTTVFINTPLPTATPHATITAVHIGASPQPTAFPTELPTDSFNVSAGTGVTLSTCTVVSTGGGSVAAMQWPDVSSGIAGYLQPDDHRPVITASGGGWYEIYLPDASAPGWVSDTNVTLEGDCSAVPAPSATVNPEESGLCYAASATGSSVSVYAGPGTRYVILRTFDGGLRELVVDTADNGWFRINIWENAYLWTGWVNPTDIVTSGNCSTLTVMTSTNYLPEHSPIETPTLPPDVPVATPTAQFGAFIGKGTYGFILGSNSGALPAGTRIAIGSGYYDGTSWYYNVYSENGGMAENVPEGQITYVR